ncbi:hypothetical protein A2680_02175 [Candidatus Kaiserbacteria bacterium RIFCSPHIGHO2_01_FULL_55_37]|nr:MAG: hypothetical protein A2680_02175 [Candidatus Kaiserbacteria bacterium RIFCSPHIGHO2_01_FULL_55_37]
MPKRGRGGLEGNMPGVSQAQRLGDKSSDVKLSARKMESETQKHIDALLFRLKEVARWTPPGRASFNVNRVGQRLEAFKRSHATHNELVMSDILYEEGVPVQVIDDFNYKLRKDLKQDQPATEQKFGMAHIRDRYFSGEALIAEAGLEFKSNEGREWLKGHIDQQLKNKHFTIETAQYVQQEALRLSSQYGPLAATLARLIFACSSNEVVGKEDAKGDSPRVRFTDTVERLRLLTDARMAEARIEGVAQKNDFFEKLREFFPVYADITGTVLKNSKSEAAEDIDDRSKQALSDFLQSQRLRTANLADTEARPPDPFHAFADALKDKSTTNPWVLSDGEQTPFDVDKFHLVFSKDVPRGIIAESIRFLNEFRPSTLAQKCNSVLFFLEKYRAQQERSKEKKGPDELPANLTKDIQRTLDAIWDLQKSKAPMPTTLKERVSILRKFEEDNSVTPADSEGGLHPFSALLRMVDARKIFISANQRLEFTNFLQKIKRINRPKEPEIQTEEGNKKYQEELATFRRKIGVIATSVKLVSNDPNTLLDLPLLEIEPSYSLRHLVALQANKWFDRDVLEGGPYPHEVPPGEKLMPLIQPRDLLGLSEEHLEKIRRNFSSAKGVDEDTKRRWLEDTGRAWSELGTEVRDVYDQILTFTRRQVQSYFGIKEKEYGIAFYPSATSAVNDLANRLIRPIERGKDYIFIFDQEFDGVTKPFIAKGARAIAIQSYDAEGRSKSPDTILAEMRVLSAREGGREPLLCVMSPKTRLGDAIMVSEDESQSNLANVGRLNEALEREWPGMFRLGDGCQSVGRTRGESELDKLHFHGFIISGGKALGIGGNVGGLILKKNPPSEEEKIETERDRDADDERARDYIEGASAALTEREQPVEAPVSKRASWFSHHPDLEVRKNPVKGLSWNEGSANRVNIAALGIALQQQNSKVDTYVTTTVADDPRQTRDRTAEHSRRMTASAIARARTYAADLIKDLYTTPGLSFGGKEAGELLSDPAISRQFGCEVTHPRHRNSTDYTYVTLSFPSLSRHTGEGEVAEGDPIEGGEYFAFLQKELSKPGYGYTVDAEGPKGIRVSFTRYQTPENIGRLFDAIREIHVASLERRMRRKEISTFEELCRQSPNL